jgi:hypothetical protein
MSITTIDPQLYDNILQRCIVHWLDHGMDLIAARELAKEQMAGAFQKGNDTSRDDELDQKENGIYG